LLIASPSLEDPNFRRTVILVGEHSEEGAIGLVLNRPSPSSVGEAVPALDGLIEGSASLFIGGPVAPSVVMVLARMQEPADPDQVVAPGIEFLAAETDLESLGELALQTRVFAGYAGWGPGQLEAEIERDDWIIHSPSELEIFCEAPESLWSSVLEGMGGQFALVARMPADPSLN